MADLANDSLNAISGVSDTFNPVASKIVIPVLILLIGLILGKLIGKIIRRALNEVQLDKHLRTKIGFKLSLERVISDLVAYVIYFIAIVMSLNSLGLTTTILYMIAAAIIIIVVASFILAVKDFFPNLMAGLMIKSKKVFGEGDLVQIKEVKGKIYSIGFLETRLRTSRDEEVIIPNSIFNKRQIVVKRRAKPVINKKEKLFELSRKKDNKKKK